MNRQGLEQRPHLIGLGQSRKLPVQGLRAIGPGRR
jgi:hypothetical protein